MPSFRDVDGLRTYSFRAFAIHLTGPALCLRCDFPREWLLVLSSR